MVRNVGNKCGHGIAWLRYDTNDNAEAQFSLPQTLGKVITAFFCKLSKRNTKGKALVDCATPKSKKVKKKRAKSKSSKQKRKAGVQTMKAIKAELPQTHSKEDKYGKIEVTESRWLSIEMIIFYFALAFMFLLPLECSAQ